MFSILICVATSLSVYQFITIVISRSIVCTTDATAACTLNQVQDVGYFTVFVPDCNENGDYKPVQCDYRYGYCWCSDENGNPVPGTTVRGKANCTAPGNIFISFWGASVL